MALSVQNKHFMTIDNINHRNNPQQREKIFLLGTFYVTEFDANAE